MKYLLPFDDYLMRAGFLRKSSNESIQMNLMVDMDDCKDAFKVFDPENPVKDVSTFLKTM